MTTTSTKGILLNYSYEHKNGMVMETTSRRAHFFKDTTLTNAEALDKVTLSFTNGILSGVELAE